MVNNPDDVVADLVSRYTSEQLYRAAMTKKQIERRQYEEMVRASGLDQTDPSEVNVSAMLCHNYFEKNQTET